MTRPAVAHTGLYSTKWLGVLLLPPGWDAIPCSSHPQQFIKASWQFAGTRSYSRVERGEMKVWCFSQEHNTINRPSLYLDLVPSSLTRRPLSLLLQVRKPKAILRLDECGLSVIRPHVSYMLREKGSSGCRRRRSLARSPQVPSPQNKFCLPEVWVKSCITHNFRPELN